MHHAGLLPQATAGCKWGFISGVRRGAQATHAGAPGPMYSHLPVLTAVQLQQSQLDLQAATPRVRDEA